MCCSRCHSRIESLRLEVMLHPVARDPGHLTRGGISIPPTPHCLPGLPQRENYQNYSDVDALRVDGRLHSRDGFLSICIIRPQRGEGAIPQRERAGKEPFVSCERGWGAGQRVPTRQKSSFASYVLGGVVQKETHPGPSASSGPPLRGGERSLSPPRRGAALAAGWVLPRPGGHLGRSYRERAHAKTYPFGPYWLSIKKSCRAGGPVLVSLA